MPGWKTSPLSSLHPWWGTRHQLGTAVQHTAHLKGTVSPIMVSSQILVQGLVLQLGYGRVSSKQTKINFGSNRKKPKQRSVSHFFRFVSWNQKQNIRCFKHISKQLKQTDLFSNKPKQTKTNWNNPKFSEKYPNTLHVYEVHPRSNWKK
jgi:hypothetical protein